MNLKLTELTDLCVLTSKLSKRIDKVLRQEPPWFQEKKERNMCLRVDANGGNEAKGTHVSKHINLMRGDNDDNLKWPFKGTIEVSLLNQLEDRQHLRRQLWSPDADIPEDARGRVTVGERAVVAWGFPGFIALRDLAYKGDRKCQYLKDDILFFRVDCFEPKID